MAMKAKATPTSTSHAIVSATVFPLGLGLSTFSRLAVLAIF